MSTREEPSEVVEIDAIAVEEWEHEQHTPMANDTNLAALVKQSAATSGPVKALDEGWNDLAVPHAAKPRTTTNTLRRSGVVEAVRGVPTAIPAGGKNKTMAFPTALVKPAMPTKRAEPNHPIMAPTSVPKHIGPRAASEPGALAAGTTKPEAPITAARTATSSRPTSAPAGMKPPALTATRPTSQATPVVAASPATRLVSQPAPPAPPPKRPTFEAAPIAATPKRPTSEVAPVAPKPVAAPGPAISKRPTLELTAKAKRASPEPVVVIRGPVKVADVAAAVAAASPTPTFEDWDDPSASTAIGNRVAPNELAASEEVSAFPRENSVIIDLGAQPTPPKHATKRAQTQPVIQTSEQSTTTSGVFVMPTAAAPNVAVPQLPPILADYADPRAISTTSEPSVLPDRSSNPWQTPLPAPRPGEPLAMAAVSPFSRTASERALDYSTPTSVSSARMFVPTPGPMEPIVHLPIVHAESWPSVAGLGYDAGGDVAITRHEPTEQASLRTSFFTPKHRRVALLAIGGAFIAILVIAMASGGSKRPATAATEAAPATAATPASAANPTRDTTPPTVPTARPATAVAVASTTNSAPTPTTPTTATTKPAPTKQAPAKRRFNAKKPVVVDYDKKPESAPDADQSLAKARSIYAIGNQRLFAGDPSGAIAQYRQALAAYPNYAASYRGIGLAYAQQANRPAALEAFKTYVTLAPAAKDVALIKKRVANLSVH